ncbi:MAG: Uma2 family endonuclease [Blastocatellia bacterium]|nr:Uma2 family endonuclease [Blastocatellia bacterium]
MALPKERLLYTVEQYLEMERASEERREYLNPTVIIEILSKSTEGFDRGEKFRRYLTHIPFLQDYVLVHQTLPWIQVYSRHPDGWLMTDAVGLEGAIRIPSIDCHLSMSEVYERVELSPLEDQEEEEDRE